MSSLVMPTCIADIAADPFTSVFGVRAGVAHLSVVDDRPEYMHYGPGHATALALIRQAHDLNGNTDGFYVHNKLPRKLVRLGADRRKQWRHLYREMAAALGHTDDQPLRREVLNAVEGAAFAVVCYDLVGHAEAATLYEPWARKTGVWRPRGWR